MGDGLERYSNEHLMNELHEVQFSMQTPANEGYKYVERFWIDVGNAKT